jgi:hypothetical protein
VGVPHLSWNEVRDRAIRFSRNWSEARSERADKQTFYNEFFEVFGIRRASVASFEANVRNLHGHTNAIDLLYRGKLIVEHKSRGQNLSQAESQAFGYIEDLTRESRFDEVPRFILVSDFANFVLYDLEPEEQRDLPLFAGRPLSRIEFTLQEFPRSIRSFAFLLGQTRVRLDPEDPANERAYKRMCDLHDSIKVSGYDGHDLEVLLVRILFCLFGEDTGIFEPESFTQFVRNQTRSDGSDLGAQLNLLFNWLHKPQADTPLQDSDTLYGFRYVNGGLFEKPLDFARCTKAARDALLECCAFHWAKISPAVFGSLFQGVMDDRTRRQQGAHYTSERDIMKVLHSLFLDELDAEWKRIKSDRSSRRRSNTEAFHQKLRSLKFLDPACGCGNFLVLAYRELRALEIDVVRELGSGEGGRQLFLPTVNVDQFHGIEYSEWPVRIAEVAMWLMDHQMNQVASEVFGQAIDRLPLKSSPHIVHGNALTRDWSDVLPRSQCSYVLGNPPFVGKHYQNAHQRAEMGSVFGDFPNTGDLDYVAAWFVKAAAYIQKTQIRVGFVATNSITQGEQVPVLWGILFQKFHLKIHFAHRPFAWMSEARGKAHVHVVIIGLGNFDVPEKFITDYDAEPDHPVISKVSNITPYLTPGKDSFVVKQQKPISDVPEMRCGNKPTDDGAFIFTDEEKNKFLRDEPEAAKYIRRFTGSEEFINGKMRWCLWLKNAEPAQLRKVPRIMDRIEHVRDFRSKSSAKPTRLAASRPTRFFFESQPETRFIAVPEVSGERRNYIPIGFLEPEIIVSNKIYVVESVDLFLFGVLSSVMHMAWVKTVSGRLESRFQYSGTMVYNTFPWPNATSDQRERVRLKAQAVLDARAPHLPPLGFGSLADLYDPLTMPTALAHTHAELDRAVEKCYRTEAFRSDRERVEFLFALYESKVNPLGLAAVQVPKNKRKSVGSGFENGLDSTDEPEVHKPSRLPKWYLEAFHPQPSLEDRGEIIKDSLDVIYDEIDEMLSAGKFTTCNRFLGAVIQEQERRDLSVLIGILTITLAAANKLPNRGKLKELVHKRLSAAGQNAEAALKGL